MSYTEKKNDVNPAWLLNRLISAEILETVLRNSENLFSTNIIIKIVNSMPVF